MDFIEVVSQTAPTFRERKLIYLHCLDLGAQESVQFEVEQFSCLQVKLVLSHVSFPEKIAERRMCGFLLQKKVIDALKDRQSPVLLEVTNSCDIKVSFSTYHSFEQRRISTEKSDNFVVSSTERHATSAPFPILITQLVEDKQKGFSIASNEHNTKRPFATFAFIPIIIHSSLTSYCFYGRLHAKSSSRGFSISVFDKK